MDNELVEVVDDDGVLYDVEEGDMDLAHAAYEYHLADTQEKAWKQRKAIAAARLWEGQPEGKAVYGGDGPGEQALVASRRRAAIGQIPDYPAIKAIEWSPAEMRQIIQAIEKLDIAALDPGLKGNNPALWRPTNSVGSAIRRHLTVGVIRSGYMLVTPATRYADGSQR